MGKFIVQIAETRNYEIEIEAQSENSASELAMDVWRNADEVGGYEIPDTTTEIVSVTAAHQ